MYRYIVYVEIFVTVNCGAEHDDTRHSKPKMYFNFNNINLSKIQFRKLARKKAKSIIKVDTHNG